MSERRRNRESEEYSVPGVDQGSSSMGEIDLDPLLSSPARVGGTTDSSTAPNGGESNGGVADFIVRESPFLSAMATVEPSLQFLVATGAAVVVPSMMSEADLAVRRLDSSSGRSRQTAS